MLVSRFIYETATGLEHDNFAPLLQLITNSWRFTKKKSLREIFDTDNKHFEK